MICSRDDLEFYLEADRLALAMRPRRPKRFGDEIWKYQRLLRRIEYCLGSGTGLLQRIKLLYLRYRFHELSLKLGIHIPPHVCGPGLNIAHIGTIVVSPAAKIGDNCRIHVCVNVGTAAGRPDEAPTIGNNVYIGPGAKLFGQIEIADDIAIGANSVVNRSFQEKGITIAGVPARKVSDKGSEGLLIRATELLKNYPSQITRR